MYLHGVFDHNYRERHLLLKFKSKRSFEILIMDKPIRTRESRICSRGTRNVHVRTLFIDTPTHCFDDGMMKNENQCSNMYLNAYITNNP